MTVSQPIMLIAGIPEDRIFVHMCYVAGHLSRMLPNFQFQKICKLHEEWEPWLKNLCKYHSWFHKSSPLVWREIGTSPNNATYVGGATQFWEFIYEYYGVESQLTKHELLSLKQDFIQEFAVETRNNELKKTHRKLNVSILGGDKSLCENLVVELLLSQNLHLANGIAVKLYNTPSQNAKLNEEIRDAAETVPTISAALANCNVLVILDEILRENEESTDHWLGRNRTATLELAAGIDSFSPNHMKVMFCSDGPTCFDAGVLAAASAKLDTNDIVVVSAHRGLQILCDVLNSIAVPLEEIGCPPVWGFLGVNHFVDVSNAVQRHEIYRPNNWALKPHKGTTLPLGVKQAQLRSIFYATYNKNPRHNKIQAGESHKCKAICDLLSLWYSKSCNADGKIISLGICSEGEYEKFRDHRLILTPITDCLGTFGIPEGIFFSQPVYLRDSGDKCRVWVPCSEFPVPNHEISIFHNLIQTAKILVERLIRPRDPSAVF